MEARPGTAPHLSALSRPTNRYSANRDERESGRDQKPLIPGKWSIPMARAMRLSALWPPRLASGISVARIEKKQHMRWSKTGAQMLLRALCADQRRQTSHIYRVVAHRLLSLEKAVEHEPPDSLQSRFAVRLKPRPRGERALCRGRSCNQERASERMQKRISRCEDSRRNPRH